MERRDLGTLAAGRGPEHGQPLEVLIMAAHDRDDEAVDETVDEPMARPDGHRYDRPESADDTRSKSWDYAVLGILVLVILVLVATGTVPIFDF
jgi:hypothetical protein